jgi:hypothetical protein
MGRMSLLSRRRLVCGQDALNELLNRIQSRSRANANLTIRRNGAFLCLTNHTPMNTKLTSNRTHAAYAERKLATQFFE